MSVVPESGVECIQPAAPDPPTSCLDCNDGEGLGIAGCGVRVGDECTFTWAAARFGLG